MIFTDIKSLVIGGKGVLRILADGKVIWSKTIDEETDLPAMYQAVEWIGNDANVGNKAYLDLGFAFDTAARIVIGQHVATLSTTYLFGAAENSGKLRCMLTSPDSGKANCILYGSTGDAYVSLTGTTLSENAVNNLELELRSGTLRSYNGTTASETIKTTQAEYTMTSNLFLLAQNYNGSARFSGVSRIGYFQYYDKTGALICDLVPCYRKSDGVIGAYDLVRRIFLTDASGGTKTFEKGGDVQWYVLTEEDKAEIAQIAAGLTDAKLDAYQRVEYITAAEEETYPYLITDVCADNDIGVEVVASFPIMQDRIPMGSRENSDATRFYCVYPLSTSSIYYGFNTGSSVSCPLKVDTVYRLQTNFLNSRLVNVYDEDGDRKGGASLSATLTPHTVPMSIFGYHSAASGNVTSKREYLLYGARISRKNEVIRDYYPCYRKSDGVVGLLDKVTMQFLTNADADGGSAFAAGEDIAW